METNNIRVSEGLLIAAIPVAGYFLAYVFERGFCQFYNIPPVFIDISIISVISTTIALVSTYALAFFFFSSSIYPFLSELHRSIKRSLFKIALPTLITAGLVIVFNFSLDASLIVVLSFLFIFLFGEFIFPLITQRETHGYLNKLEAQNELDLVKYDDVLYKLIKRHRLSIFSMLFIFVTFLYASYIAGGMAARFKTEFWISAESPNVVYLRKYGDTLLGNRFDRDNKILTEYFIIEPIGKNSLKLETLGKLQPFKIEKPNKSLSHAAINAPPD